jgi:FHS family L-fucose permease-like MFS transporter
MTAAERAMLPAAELSRIQGIELRAVTMTYITIGLVMVGIFIAILLTKMPSGKEDDKRIDFAGTFRRLMKNRNSVWGIVAQFFYVGAQIAVWSFIIRYAMQQLQLDQVIAQLGRGHLLHYVADPVCDRPVFVYRAHEFHPAEKPADPPGPAGSCA